MFGFGCCCCAAAGVLAGPDNDSDISIVAPRSAAQERLCQPVATLHNRFGMRDVLSLCVQSNMASPSLFASGKKSAASNEWKGSLLAEQCFTRPAWGALKDG
jgi:hypothetical protein